MRGICFGFVVKLGCLRFWFMFVPFGVLGVMFVWWLGLVGGCFRCGLVCCLVFNDFICLLVVFRFAVWDYCFVCDTGGVLFLMGMLVLVCLYIV